MRPSNFDCFHISTTPKTSISLRKFLDDGCHGLDPGSMWYGRSPKSFPVLSRTSIFKLPWNCSVVSCG